MSESKLMYLFIYKKLKERSRANQLKEKQFKIILGRLYRVPKPQTRFILQEMMNIGLLDVENNHKSPIIRLKKINLNKEIEKTKQKLKNA